MMKKDANYYSPERFKGKIIVITGSANGIGRAVAIRAAQEGADMALIDLNRTAGEDVLKIVQGLGSNSIFIPANVSNAQVVTQTFRDIMNYFGRIDAAINNVGTIGTRNPIHLQTDEGIMHSLNVNLVSAFFCARAEINCFLKNKNSGSIVNTASVAGIVGMPGNPIYTAAKHGINGLTKNMALDYAKFGIRVNSVNPGPTETAMIRPPSIQSFPQMTDSKEQWDFSRDKSENMQHRNAMPEEQAASILFLASAEASHITGTIFATDGGWSAF